ncbi:xanthine dehydrogenase accessory protein XdhC [Sphingomonas sp. M1-B02]|uniref:xanthine dehydrogenase accessory protein XdhC n=1 Tax=Sphingomonas sp. M1-B02 TaxID=3114300 RepID=UPI002240A57D|nr:xanthine dehydrogenase accessory protein XdhC [Sphingomonas sp. S6-11]UZK66446.1 xanthine dehydrogenase accessory protein XdhC [Sphingomonas sp. S6-11]
MTDWRANAREVLAEGPAALVTILATEGSAPRGAGARMLVTRETLRGTIGGGALEHQVTAQARAILDHPPGSWRIQDYPLGPLLGQCCGGRVRLMVERLASVPAEGPHLVSLGETIIRKPHSGDSMPRLGARGPLPGPGAIFLDPVETDSRPVLLFGAGHVATALVERAAGLPLRTAWYDSREALAQRQGVVLASEEELVACAGEAAADTAVLIVTHDHALDYRLVTAALRSPALFVGMIGSRTKRARFISRLAADGVDTARLTCPIGLPGIAGKEPEVIAIAVLAQLLSLRNAT